MGHLGSYADFTLLLPFSIIVKIKFVCAMSKVVMRVTQSDVSAIHG